jgi:hypothetical protein
MANNILSLVQDTLVDFVGNRLGSDISRIRTGRLQDDPTDRANYKTIAIHVNDPNKAEGWMHELTSTNQKRGDVGPRGYFPFGEIGIGLMYTRRFVAEVNVYLVENGKTSRQGARDLYNDIFVRAERALADSGEVLQGVHDDYGEMCTGFVQVVKSYATEGGGPPDSFIWRGFIYFEVLTSKVD